MRKSQEMDITEKSNQQITKRPVAIYAKIEFYTERLQCQRPLPQNRKTPRGSAQHVQHNLFQ